MMKTRTAVRAISLLAAAAVCLGAETLLLRARADTADRQLRYQGERAFEALCGAAGGLDASLKKSLYAVTPGMTAALCAEICSRAQAASDALSSLPFPLQELENTAGFFNRTGDYAAWLLRRSGGGETVSEADRDNLRALSETASLLSDNLYRLRGDLADGAVSPTAAAAAEAGLPSLSDSFLQMEQEFPELPTLVYDGPFSADIADRPPRMTAGGRVVEKEAALLIAGGFLGVRSNVCTVLGEETGPIPAWRVGAEGWTLSVSRSGGYVVRAVADRTVLHSAITAESALAAARRFLSAHGYGELRESYHMQQENVLTSTWCAVQDGAFCYPDMVKVSVAMDTGDVVGFDAAAFLTSHANRELPAAVFTEEEAAAQLPAGLTLQSQRLAVIPSAGAEEIFCRELTCLAEDGSRCLVYFNAVTGRQERILLLLEDETGTLAL